MNKDLNLIASIPVVGSLWADVVGAWFALADASNMLNSRVESNALDEQNDAIERALASRAARAPALASLEKEGLHAAA